MAFDFSQIFDNALSVGLDAAKPGGKMAEDWVRASAKANEDALRDIAEQLANGGISKDTARYLLGQNERALRAEAAALKVIVQAAAESALNGFFAALRSGLLTALNVVL